MLTPGSRRIELVQVHELWPDGEIRFTSPCWTANLILEILTDTAPLAGGLFHIGLVEVPDELDEVFTRASDDTPFAVQLWQRVTETEVRNLLPDLAADVCPHHFPQALTYVLPRLSHLYTTALGTWRAVPVPNPALRLPGVPPTEPGWRGGVLALDAWPDFAPATSVTNTTDTR